MKIQRMVLASEAQVNYIKRLCEQTRTRLNIDNEQISELDVRTAKFLIKSLRTTRMHRLIHPDCRSKVEVDLTLMQQASSCDREITVVQKAMLKSMHENALITAQQYNEGLENSQNAFYMIRDHYKQSTGNTVDVSNLVDPRKESFMFKEIQASRRGPKAKGPTSLTEEQKLQAKEMFEVKKMMIKDIAEVLHIEKHYVGRFLNSIGLGGQANSSWIGSPEHMAAIRKGVEKNKQLAEERRNNPAVMEEYRRKQAEKKAKKLGLPSVSNQTSTPSGIQTPVKIEPNRATEVVGISLEVNGMKLSGNPKDLAEILKHLK